MRIILEFRIIFGRKNRYVVTVLLCQLPNKVSSISAVKMQTGFEFWWIHHYFQYFIYMQEPQKIGKLNAKQIRDFPFISISIVDDLDWTREKKKESACITYLATSIDSSIKAFQPFSNETFCSNYNVITFVPFLPFEFLFLSWLFQCTQRRWCVLVFSI